MYFLSLSYLHCYELMDSPRNAWRSQHSRRPLWSARRQIQAPRGTVLAVLAVTPTAIGCVWVSNIRKSCQNVLDILYLDNYEVSLRERRSSNIHKYPLSSKFTSISEPLYGYLGIPCIAPEEGWNRISRWGVDVDVLVHGLPIRFLIWPAQREDLSNSYPGISWEPIDPMNLAMEEITETDDQPWDLFPGYFQARLWHALGTDHLWSSRFCYSQSTELKTICNSSSSSRSSTEAMLHALRNGQANFWDHRMADRSCTPPASFASPPPGSPPCQPSTLAWGFDIPWPYRSNESIFVSACHLLRLKWGTPIFHPKFNIDRFSIFSETLWFSFNSERRLMGKSYLLDPSGRPQPWNSPDFLCLSAWSDFVWFCMLI